MRLKILVNKIAEIFGYRISRVYRNSEVAIEEIPELVKDKTSTNIPEFVHRFKRIPGMVPANHGLYLYMLAYASSLRGDIIEIGSWQGRATCFLAQACKDSNNGIVHAIDHFRGNPGKESYYRVLKEDLSDLKDNFLQNVSMMGLSQYVKLYAMDSSDALAYVKEGVDRVRILFIDGNHNYEAVAKDIKNYSELVSSGGLIIFDDYSYNFPGVLQAVEELIFNSEDYVNAVQSPNMLIVKKRSYTEL